MIRMSTMTVLLLSLTTAGCLTEDTMRYNGVTQSAGNAIAANTVMQMVDPWPNGVQDTDLEVPAERPEKAEVPEESAATETVTLN